MDKIISEYKKTQTEVFWGELAPGDHVCQLYESEASFLNTLETYVIDGLKKQEGIVLICTPEHLKVVAQRLKANGFDPEELKQKGLYFPFIAQETLDKFMRGEWPDEELFKTTILDILNTAKLSAGKVRAFGEMVAILWKKGHHGATVTLENYWQKLCSTDHITLYCAYPKSGFTQNTINSLKTICDCHNKLISGVDKTKREMKFYNYSQSGT